MNECETSASPEADALLAEPTRPPLSIGHLFLWTFCSGLYLACTRQFLAWQGPSDEYVLLQQVNVVLHSVVSGAVWAGAITLLAARIRHGFPLWHQPGHWLLLVTGAMTALWVCTMVLVVWLDQSGRMQRSILGLTGVLHLFPIVAYTIAVRVHRQMRWRLFFLALTITSVIQSVAYSSVWFGGVGRVFIALAPVASLAGIVLPILLVGVSGADLLWQQRRDWLHWTGVGAYVASLGITSWNIIWSWFR
jgi:hypothetical protein